MDYGDDPILKNGFEIFKETSDLSPEEESYLEILLSLAYQKGYLAGVIKGHEKENKL